MPDAFDPYLEWLDIPAGQRPPDHYQLLGLSASESDPDRIAHEADVRMARLRKIRPGDHAKQWGELLDELGAAKACLLDPASRAKYDAERSDQSAARPAPTSPASGPVMATPPGLEPSPVAQTSKPIESTATAEPETTAEPQTAQPQTPAEPIPVDEAPVEQSVPVAVSGPSVTVVAKRSSLNTVVVTALLAMVVILGAAVIYQKFNQPDKVASSGDSEGTSEAEGQPAPVSPAHSSPESPEPQTQPPRDVSPPSTDPPTEPFELPQSIPPNPAPLMPEPGPAELPETPVDPVKQQAFRKAAGDARYAMAERDKQGTYRFLDDAAKNAQTSEELAELERLKAVLAYYEEFWSGISESLTGLDGGIELVIKDTRIVVVECSANHLIVKHAGQLRSWRVDEIPTSIVRVLADRWFAKVPSTKALMGTFLLVDLKGDRDEARQLWQEASRQGIDLTLVMPELDVDYSAGSSGSFDALPEPVVPEPGPAVAENPPPATGGGKQNKKPAPPNDPDRLQQAEQLVRAMFQLEYAAATTNPKRLELAEQLLAQGAATENNPEAQYVMLREARDLAAVSGKVSMACEAIDRMAGFYAINPLQMKVATLQQAGEEVGVISGQQDIATTALELVEQAIKAKQIDEAAGLATLAAESARKARSRTLAQQAAAAAIRVEGLRKQ